VSFGSRSLNPPTAEELERWQQIKAMGICCVTHKRGPVEIHHLLSPGGLRLGHRYTVGLAPEVHAGVKVRDFKSRWPNQALLDKQDEMLCWGPKATIPDRPQRKRKSRCTAASNQVKRPASGFA
jgi:hypothetical protein